MPKQANAKSLQPASPARPPGTPGLPSKNFGMKSGGPRDNSAPKPRG